MKQGARAYPPNQWAAINDNERGLTLEIDSYQKSISDYAFEKIYFLHVKKIWKTFNDDLPRFHNLIKFYASSIPLLKIPTSLCYLRHLKTLSVRSCALDSLPSELAQMKSLNTLDIARNNFSTLPEVICGIRTLHVLIACSCGITRLPDWLIHSSIKCLQIDDNYITVLPASYFLIYWMHPPVQRYTTDDCQVLILLANPLMTSPKTSKQNIEPFLCKNSDVVPSLVRLAANVCAALIPNIAKRSETLPQELRELFSRNMRECDRCRKKFAFPFKVIRFQSWQVRRSTLFLRKENKCARDPNSITSPSIPPLPLILKTVKEEEGKEESTLNSSLPFDPLTRPRAEPQRKSAKKKKRKMKKKIREAIAALSVDNDKNDEVSE